MTNVTNLNMTPIQFTHPSATACELAERICDTPEWLAGLMRGTVGNVMLYNMKDFKHTAAFLERELCNVDDLADPLTAADIYYILRTIDAFWHLHNFAERYSWIDESTPIALDGKLIADMDSAWKIPFDKFMRSKERVNDLQVWENNNDQLHYTDDLESADCERVKHGAYIYFGSLVIEDFESNAMGDGCHHLILANQEYVSFNLHDLEVRLFLFACDAGYDLIGA